MYVRWSAGYRHSTGSVTVGTGFLIWVREPKSPRAQELKSPAGEQVSR